MSQALPPIRELLPQRGAMRLLDSVLEHGGEGTRCAVDPAASGLFQQADGSLPAWLALEYMAQCAAADGALRLRAAAGSGAPRRALLVGSRRLLLHRPWLDAQRGLEVTARHASGRGRRFAFDCALREAATGAPLAEGRINVVLLEEGDGDA